MYVWQNSWGITTRTIGVMTMVHGDDKGLVLPPRVASLQVVVVPCGLPATATQEQIDAVMHKVQSVAADLKAAGVRVRADVRDNYTAGWKFNHWEMKGVPLRLELGPKDIARGEVKFVRRDNSAKSQVALEGIADTVRETLKNIQTEMYARAKKVHDAGVAQVDTVNNPDAWQ